MDLKEKMQKALLNARAICEKAEEEERDFTPEERNQIEGWMKEAGDLKEKIRAAEGDAKLRQAVLDLNADIELLDGKQRGGDGQPAAQPGKGKTIGEAFVNSPQFSGWMKSIGGRLSDEARGVNSPPVEFKGLIDGVMRRKELITGESDTSAGAFVRPDYTGIYEAIGRYPLSVLDLVRRQPTSSDLVHWVRETRQVQEAEPTPEANVTTFKGATGEISGVKPEGTMRFEPVTEPVSSIPVWIPVSTRALADAPMIRALIDDSLRGDVHEELENQILNGDGIGENFTGILNTAGILAQAFDTDMLITCRRAITSVQWTGRARPNGWVFNPFDWENIELLRDDGGRFYWGGPLTMGRSVLWQVPVSTSVLVPQGTALLGDWRKAVVFDRQAATIAVSDSHADFFIRNLVAIRCELRAALGVIRPQGFCVVDLEPGS